MDMPNGQSERADFYVYAHHEADTGRLFYIGKGSRRRAWSSCSRNRHWRAIASKHGFTVTILQRGLNEADALALEASLISAQPPGILATYTAGGGGISGYRHTEATKARMSAARAGRPLSEASRARLSATIRGRPDLIAARRAAFSASTNPAKSDAGRARSSDRMRTNNPMSDPEIRRRMAEGKVGTTLSPEARQKLSAALTGRKRGPMPENVRLILAAVQRGRRRPVKTDCGLWFESTAAASREVGVRQGNIVNACAGRARTAGGFVWRYAAPEITPTA